MYLSSIYLFQISLFNSFAHILIRLFIFLLLNVLRSLYFFEFNLYNWVSMTMLHLHKSRWQRSENKENKEKGNFTLFWRYGNSLPKFTVSEKKLKDIPLIQELPLVIIEENFKY